MNLTVTVGDKTATVEPDTAALSWAERCTGQSYEDIGEASLQMAVAYYYVEHGRSADVVDWGQIHDWAAARQITTRSS